MHNQTRTERVVDEHGCPVVRVWLCSPRGLFATLDAADFDQWQSAGKSLAWYLNGNGQGTFARLIFTDEAVAGEKATVAREIVAAGPGRRVGYRDRNPLNLCRSNLRVTEGFARGQTRIDASSLLGAQPGIRVAA